MDDGINLWLLLGGLGLGAIFGILVQRASFCMMAAMSNLALMRDYRQLHAWMAAAAVAILGTLALESTGLVEIGASAYRNPRLDWAGAVLGGLIFGFGTTLAGGCAARTVVRVAEGNVGSLLTLVSYGLAAMITLFGLLEPARGWLIEHTALALPSGDASLATALNLPSLLLGFTLALVFGLIIVFTGRQHRDLRLLVTGAAIGLVVVAGWWLTGDLAQDEFDPRAPTSLTFSGPLARAFLFITTGSQTGTHFGVALVGGTLLGAWLGALARGSFRWVLPDSAYIPHLLVGGIMMGTGAILAGGCNIGQGLSGLSTIALQSIIAIGAIFTGMRLGIAWLQRSERRVTKATAPRPVTAPRQTIPQSDHPA